jgi:hypothetical protein
MDEVTRIERIDARADVLLKSGKYEGIPATEVWDIAADEIDRMHRMWEADRQMVADMERDGLL